jgi:hypothetical protein
VGVKTEKKHNAVIAERILFNLSACFILAGVVDAIKWRRVEATKSENR